MCELGLQVRPAIKTIEAVEVDEEKLWLYGVACCTNLEVYICCLAFLPLGWGEGSCCRSARCIPLFSWHVFASRFGRVDL